MKTYLNFRKVSLALILSIILNSCVKDTDLLSEYIIKDSDKIEVFSFSDAMDNVFTTTDYEENFKIISKDDINKSENNGLKNPPNQNKIK